MSENRFNCIVILDSIPDGELNTARRLYEDLEICAAAYSPTPGIAYLRVENESSLFDYFRQLRLQNEQNDVFPLLHIESHGYEDGLQLSDRSLVSWKRLKEVLIPLNVAMRLNLMVVLASCFGGAFTKVLLPTDRAPVWGLIGPTQEISSGELETHFSTFYRTLFFTGSPKAAIDAFNQVSDHSKYWKTTAEWFFYNAWKGYKEKLCTPQKLKARARGIRNRAKLQKMVPLLKVSEFKKRLIRQEPEEFNKFRDCYFMYDLYPENQQRFSVTYKKAEAFDDR